MISYLKKVERNQYYLLLLAFFSTACFWLAWPTNRLAPLLWIAFIPLLLIERHIATHSYERPYRTFYKYSYLTLFLWNLTTTWWVAHALLGGAVFMVFVNTFVMSIPLPLFQWTAKHQGVTKGYVALVAYWVTMEHFHLQWQFSFPWLNLGNGFALFPSWIQWYEYTGALGGTIWILTANILLAQLLLTNCPTWRKAWGATAGLWILLPILHSYHTYIHYVEQGEEVEMVTMQPNIHPETRTFVDTGEFLPIRERVERFIKLSKQQLTEKTRFLVWPEVAINGHSFDEQILHRYPVIERLVEFKQQYPQLSLLTGITSLVSYPKKATKTARFSERHNFYYDVFNTALFVGQQGILDIYHKFKLVPGAELIPYLYTVRLPKAFSSGFGSRVGSLGRQRKPTVFFNKDNVGVAPVICYESVYGDYLSEFVCKGASLLFAITVDGWWRNTPGHQQHFHYTRLRAIESRRGVVRSAYNGISGFVNQRGDVLKVTKYEEQAVIRHTLQANTTLTFYVRHSDYIPMAAIWLSCVFIFLVIIGRKWQKNSEK
ncbi:MAG: apolipoprotein N-acyltransferase [Bacteroidota bacterium]